jgi:mRNA-degrading endonuclease RelE of RelBE toxin-antitoxin system
LLQLHPGVLRRDRVAYLLYNPLGTDFSTGARIMWSVQLSPAAAETLHTLTEEDRSCVLNAVGRLALGPNPPGFPQPYRLRNRPDLFVLRAGSRYRVAYTIRGTEEVVVIVDVVAHDTVADYPQAAAS